MTHGLTDFYFTYGIPNTISKVKEIISDWKDVRRVKSGVPTWDTTPGYPLWQVNRGKGFKAPVITGPEPTMHMFDDPIDYKAEMDFRYKDAFKQLEEKETMLIEKRATYKDERKISFYRNHIAKEDQALKSYGSQIQALRQDIVDKNQMLRVSNDRLAFLESENAKLQDNVTDFAETNAKWSKLYTTLEHGTDNLLEDIRDVTFQARKSAKKIQEVEAKLPPGEIQKLSSDLAKELNHILEKLSLRHPYRTRSQSKAMDDLGHAQEEIKEEMNQMKE
ncbi:hypothetical protein PIB30_084778 [Stylosanthes scabra]|uniref:Uncharacterized protein n=1 Tax=Stylosanthes scabra TaxID=79078 RepID=A0ABU6YSZ1_9FABA|nr:hypothetical protein [Stylosanthes scabra]